MRRNTFLTRHLLILLIHQQFLCHGSWATRTPATSITPATQQPLVSSSEATLLTTHVFPAAAALMQRQFDATDYDADAFNEISSASSTATSAEELDPPGAAATETNGNNRSKKNRYKIVSVHSNCTRDLFEMQIELNRGFRGLLYAKDFPLECRARGMAHTNVTLRLPTSGCGVRAEPRPNGNMELSVRVMLQMEQKLHQSSDILRTVRCKLPPNAMAWMSVAPPPLREGKMRQSYRNGRMRTFDSNNNANKNDTNHHHQHEEQQSDSDITKVPQQQQTTTTTTSTTSSTPRVRIWLELFGGPDSSGSVEVGQATTLTVRAIVPGTMGVRVVDCAALDGLGESTQQLLDERGCPIDEQVMPALHTRFKPAEEGWSKHHEDDLVEKIFTATFPAFKFPDRERLHVSCGVQLCKGKCPNINCRSTEKLILLTDTHLARIEVFNSLAVTAPQIEVDRLRHYNMSVEEYPPHIRPLPTEGTLCLSVSKLAISFCVLGLIFLIAIIVAICSLIRSRRRAAGHACGALMVNNGTRMHRDVCTSMFSSSSDSAHSARFGSKLFMPYYPNTLPYGRVY